MYAHKGDSSLSRSREVRSELSLRQRRRQIASLIGPLMQQFVQFQRFIEGEITEDIKLPEKLDVFLSADVPNNLIAVPKSAWLPVAMVDIPLNEIV
jgi:hypothetical protein